MTMDEGMREKSLPLEGASEVVLSLEEEGFLLRCLGLVALEESVEERFMGTSLRDGRSCWIKTRISSQSVTTTAQILIENFSQRRMFCCKVYNVLILNRKGCLRLRGHE